MIKTKVTHLSNKKISLFVDICAAPGNYSKLLQKRFEDSYGVGISLPIEKGGVKFEIDSKKYKIFMIDILEKDYKIQVPKKLILEWLHVSHMYMIKKVQQN